MNALSPPRSAVVIAIPVPDHEAIETPQVSHPPAAAWKVGATPAPLDVRTCVAVPTAVIPTALVPFPKRIPLAVRVATPVPPPATGSPVQFVRVPDVGVPSNGVVNVGDVANTASPVPVSSVRAVASCAEVKEPKIAALPVEVI